MVETDDYKIGFAAEEIAREFLKGMSMERKCSMFFQADLIAEIKRKWYYLEVKGQSMYKSPPFDGHGLSKRKTEIMIKFYKNTGVIPVLFVVDLMNDSIFYENLMKLESGKKYITKGQRKRVIYPLENFKHMQLKEEWKSIISDKYAQ